MALCRSHHLQYSPPELRELWVGGMFVPMLSDHISHVPDTGPGTLELGTLGIDSKVHTAFSLLLEDVGWCWLANLF